MKYDFAEPAYTALFEDLSSGDYFISTEFPCELFMKIGGDFIEDGFVAFRFDTKTTYRFDDDDTVTQVYPLNKTSFTTKRLS